MIKLIQTLALLALCTNAIGSGILGAHLGCKPHPNTSSGYIITLSLYVDGASEELNDMFQEVYLVKNDMHWETEGIWRCSNSCGMKKVSSTKVQQDAVRCDGTSTREIFLNIYEGYIDFSASEPSDLSNGAVLAWHSTLAYRGNRDKNFVESSNLAEWVTTTIPLPLVDRIFSTKISSPTIGAINTFVVCKDKLAQIKIPATDGDGDEIKYRLSTPYAITGVDLPPVIYNIPVGHWVWANGYSEQNPIHGNPGLIIDEDTGEMSVKPTEEGQYFFCISVDEYRNGKKIGSVSFSYTLTVVACNVEQQALDKKLYNDTSAVQTLTLCEGSEATLTSKQSFPNPQPKLQWTKDGKVIWGETSQSIIVHEAGNYQLLTTDINGCPDSFDSEIVRVSVVSSAVAEMDSIAPICDVATPPILMYASPAGGTFAGPGVSKNTFDPGIAGVGRHEVEYAIQGTDACPGSVARRQVVVGETPVLHLTDVLSAFRGKPISIGTTDSLNVTYQWSPPTYLNNATYANPTSTPLGNITYTVTATNLYGCSATHEVKVRIIENVLIPDAFTPNNDGINEKWELKGIAEYPNCRVTIYNRWGTVIFHSVGYQTAFDGTVGGAPQMPGVYAYKIRLTENSPEMTGSLTLIR